MYINHIQHNRTAANSKYSNCANEIYGDCSKQNNIKYSQYKTEVYSSLWMFCEPTWIKGGLRLLEFSHNTFIEQAANLLLVCEENSSEPSHQSDYIFDPSDNSKTLCVVCISFEMNAVVSRNNGSFVDWRV